MCRIRYATASATRVRLASECRSALVPEVLWLRHRAVSANVSWQKASGRRLEWRVFRTRPVTFNGAADSKVTEGAVTSPSGARILWRFIVLLKSVVVPCGYSGVGFVAGAGGGATRGRYDVSLPPSAAHGLNLLVGQPGVQRHIRPMKKERKKERWLFWNQPQGSVKMTKMAPVFAPSPATFPPSIQQGRSRPFHYSKDSVQWICYTFKLNCGCTFCHCTSEHPKLRTKWRTSERLLVHTFWISNTGGNAGTIIPVQSIGFALTRWRI